MEALALGSFPLRSYKAPGAPAFVRSRSQKASPSAIRRQVSRKPDNAIPQTPLLRVTANSDVLALGPAGFHPSHLARHLVRVRPLLPPHKRSTGSGWPHERQPPSPQPRHRSASQGCISVKLSLSNVSQAGGLARRVAAVSVRSCALHRPVVRSSPLASL